MILPSWVDKTLLEETPWERIGPGMVFVPVAEGKAVKNRLHIDLAPHTSQDRDAEIARLERLGATRVDVGQPGDATWTVLADPEGNEFCVLSSRDMGSANGSWTRVGAMTPTAVHDPFAGPRQRRSGG